MTSREKNVAAALAAASATSPQQQAIPAHSDDGYCALCRRCQMRKKLEKRLADRNNNNNNSNSNIGSSARIVATGVGGRDERPIDELLDYIEAGNNNRNNNNMNSNNNARGSKARRKRAAAMRRKKQLAEVDRKGPLLHGVNGNVNRANGNSNNIHNSGMASTTEETTSSSAGSTQDDAEDSCGVCEHQKQTLCIGANSNSQDDDGSEVDDDQEVEDSNNIRLGSPPGYDDDTDRQVEEFRRLLEAAHSQNHRPRRILVHHTHS